MTKLLVTYTKSTIGYSKTQKATVRALGLRKLQSQVLHDDTPAVRGMVFHVRHLVSVAEVADDTVLARRAPGVRPRVIAAAQEGTDETA
ncbi:MAG: 50S ribosomal protein L30 [Chloroflexi bacterium]|jgi:large subunit ribosomal protein L30|nr:50S ribosomal protein L30 [Chloroflexota bacterium]